MHPVRHRLKSLACHRIMRGRIADPGFIGLVRNGWAERQFHAALTTVARCNYIITVSGEQAAYDIGTQEF